MPLVQAACSRDELLAGVWGIDFETGTNTVDVFVYVGDLTAVFAGAARALRPGATFAFSVESVYAAGALAFHAAYKWVTAEQMAEILEGIASEYTQYGAASK